MNLFLNNLLPSQLLCPTHLVARAPAASDAGALAAPPRVDVVVVLRVILVVKQSAEAAEEVRVDEFAGVFPSVKINMMF